MYSIHYLKGAWRKRAASFGLCAAVCVPQAGPFRLSALGRHDAEGNEGGGSPGPHTVLSAGIRPAAAQPERRELACTSRRQPPPSRRSGKEGGGRRRESAAGRGVPGKPGCADVTGRAIRAGAL